MKAILGIANLAVIGILVGLFFILDQLRTDVILAFLAGQVLWNVAYRLQSGKWFDVEPVEVKGFASLIDSEQDAPPLADRPGKSPQAQ